MSKLAVFLLATALFCAFVNGQDESDEYEEEEDCPCITPFIWKPKCGSDGQTYPNAKAIECQNECGGDNVIIAHDGVCKGDADYGIE